MAEHSDGAGAADLSVAIERLGRVFHDQPVRLAVLFGSQADGTASEASDVDIVVEFDESVDDRRSAKVALLTALSVALDRNDIDLSLVSDIDPEVGAVAFSTGRLLCGSRDRFDHLADRFARQRPSDDRSLRDRFDRALDNVDRLVEEGA